MAYCVSYCSHGGVCILEDGHMSPHDSEYCTWENAEALTKIEADALLYAKMGDDPFADFIVDNT